MLASMHAVGGQGKDGARADALKDYVGPFANKAIIKVNAPLCAFETCLNGDLNPSPDND
jgi:hypothetical protein